MQEETHEDDIIESLPAESPSIEVPAANTPEAVTEPWKKYLSLVAFLLAVAASVFLRFYQLDLKPLHHDEGVNSYFLLNLYNHHSYKYDPTNYHGPSLYYFVVGLLKVFGQTEFALRFFPSLCGVLTVAMLWFLRRGLGLIGTPVAAWSMALCPGLVYYSRDFIHESSFGFFTIGLIVTAYNWKKAASPILFAIFAGLLYVTKETSVHTTAVLALAVLCALGWDYIRSLLTGKVTGLPKIDFSGITRFLINYLPSFLIIFVTIYLVFYTSFFTNARGPLDFIKSVFMWTGRGVHEGIHDHAPTYYLGILLKLELPLILVVAAGVPITLWRGRKFGLFLMAVMFGMVLGYSAIPYKTPWLMVSMLIALTLYSGYAVQVWCETLSYLPLQAAVILLVASAAVPVAKTSWLVNFEKYEDNENHTAYFKSLGEKLKLRPYTDTQYGYVYAQTANDALNLVKAIQRANPSDIQISSPDYWPLPWYLKNLRVSSYSQELPEGFALPALIASSAQSEQFTEKLSEHYYSEEFVLRPGVDLVLWLRK